jgi:hypothetical protein
MMESFDRYNAVVDLGKRLVTELSLGNDLTAQWMAHLIAERMDAAERATGEERAIAQEACQQVIFGLWEHRDSLPSHLRPFKQLDPLVQTLSSLSVKGGTRFRYLTSNPSDEDLDSVKDDKQLLAAAVSLDYTARVLIQQLLSDASAAASEKVIPWLDAAVSAGAEVAAELALVTFVWGDEETLQGDALVRESLSEKIEKLESFSQLAAVVVSEYRERLSQLEDGDGG